MKNIKEILRLASAGTFSARQIAKSCNCSSSTVTAVLERAKNAEFSNGGPLINEMSDDELETRLYLDERYSSERPIPDMNFIHSELKKKGVTLQLRWQAYLEH